MTVSLEVLRQAVLKAARDGVLELQMSLAEEGTYAISQFQWEWYGPAGPDNRNIVDTEALMRSIKPSAVEVSTSSVTASLEWDPTDPLTGEHYADLVHNGEEGYFWDEESDKTYDYTARPWTFLLMPSDQRPVEMIGTTKGLDPESLPTDSWDAAFKRFKVTFRNSLATRVRVIG